MAEISENLIKFGYLNESEIAGYIASGDLDKYNVCFTRDTKRIILLNGNKDLVPLKTRVSIYSSVDSAIDSINNDTSSYDGEIISIKNGDAFDAYIVYTMNNRKFIKPVYEEADLDYNLLSNVPIKNLDGSVTSPIVLSSLSDGYYKITGHFITPQGTEVTSIVGNYIIVENVSLSEKHIKRISSDLIFDYVVKTDGTYTVKKYVTDEYIQQQNFATEEYVDNKISALQATLEAYIREYIETTVTLLIKHIVDEELDSRYSTTEDINNLFN